MQPPKIHWAGNIKFLRSRAKLSQDELAATLSISRSKLNAHENGNTVNPTAEDLVAFSAHFGFSIDTLLKLELSQLSASQLAALEAGNDAFITGTKLRVLTTTVDKHNNENAAYVPVKARAGYAAGYTDPEYIAALPRFSLPNLPANRTYRMFPTTGKSMLPVPEGSLIIAEYVQDWLAIKNDTLCIIILKNAGPDFVFKQVENKVRESRSLLLKSLNEAFKPYEVPVAEVLEVWKMVSYVSDVIPAGNISLGLIAETLQDIKTEISRIGDKVHS